MSWHFLFLLADSVKLFYTANGYNLLNPLLYDISMFDFNMFNFFNLLWLSRPAYILNVGRNFLWNYIISWDLAVIRWTHMFESKVIDKALRDSGNMKVWGMNLSFCGERKGEKEIT